MKKANHTITINVEKTNVERWVDGQLVKVGETLSVINAKGTDGSNHSNQYRTPDGKLMTFEQYVEMMKSRFQYGTINVVVFDWVKIDGGFRRKKGTETFVA